MAYWHFWQLVTVVIYFFGGISLIRDDRGRGLRCTIFVDVRRRSGTNPPLTTFGCDLPPAAQLPLPIWGTDPTCQAGFSCESSP